MKFGNKVHQKLLEQLFILVQFERWVVL
jgi:hypothetical protein